MVRCVVYCAQETHIFILTFLSDCLHFWYSTINNREILIEGRPTNQRKLESTNLQTKSQLNFFITETRAMQENSLFLFCGTTFIQFLILKRTLRNAWFFVPLSCSCSLWDSTKNLSQDPTNSCSSRCWLVKVSQEYLQWVWIVAVFSNPVGTQNVPQHSTCDLSQTGFVVHSTPVGKSGDSQLFEQN